MLRTRVFALACLFVGVALGCGGCFANPETSAGYAGYITHGAWFGKSEFVGIQHGPTSTGIGWMLHVDNVSITPYSYDEEFAKDSAVLSKDNLKISFAIHIVWKVRGDDASVRAFFEKYSILEQGKGSDKIAEVAYANFVREPLRTFARDEVQRRDGLKVKEDSIAIGESVKHRVDTLTEGTPFEVVTVVVGNIQYPSEVADAVSAKLAATQKLEQQDTQLQIVAKQAEQRIAEAKGIAGAMEIINARLSAAYLQHEAIEAQKAMVGSPNHTTIYIPSGANGVPLVGTLDMTPRHGGKAAGAVAASDDAAPARRGHDAASPARTAKRE